MTGNGVTETNLCKCCPFSLNLDHTISLIHSSDSQWILNSPPCEREEAARIWQIRWISRNPFYRVSKKKILTSRKKKPKKKHHLPLSPLTSHLIHSLHSHSRTASVVLIVPNPSDSLARRMHAAYLYVCVFHVFSPTNAKWTATIVLFILPSVVDDVEDFWCGTAAAVNAKL